MTSSLLVAVGLVLLTLGAELLVRGAVALARTVGLPSLIIGLTVVAYGTSAPEFAVSLKAGLGGQADIALGNVVGSNTVNVLFILGISALVAPLAVSAQLVRLDVPVMIGASVLAWVVAADGMVGRWEGLALVAGIVAYTALLVRLGKKQQPPESSQVPSRSRSRGPADCSCRFYWCWSAWLFSWLEPDGSLRARLTSLASWESANC